jgi:hypothetical protein
MTVSFYLYNVVSVDVSPYATVSIHIIVTATTSYHSLTISVTASRRVHVGVLVSAVRGRRVVNIFVRMAHPFGGALGRGCAHAAGLHLHEGSTLSIFESDAQRTSFIVVITTILMKIIIRVGDCDRADG